MRYKYFITLIKKDLLLEVRQQYTLYGIGLYVLSTVFVVYMAMGQPETVVWNGLFWVIQLFISINAIAKSFLQHNKGLMLYFYTIVPPQIFILSKLLFNAILMFIMSLLSLLLFMLLLGNPLEYTGSFIGITLLGGCSISLVFTFLAAIAAKAQQQTALMAILGFPLLIPQLLILMKISNIAFASVLQSGLPELILLLCSFDILVIALSLILFPFLWRD
jgi:heme exporter protein B